MMQRFEILKISMAGSGTEGLPTELVWSNQARADLLEIYVMIGLEQPAAATAGGDDAKPIEVAMDQDRAEIALRSFLDSERMDRIAEYVQRGRKYGPLGDDRVIAKWLAGIKALADAPGDQACYAEHEDIEAELALRKIDPPYDEAQPDLDRYMESSEAVIRTIEADPDSPQNREDVLRENLRAFLIRRDWSN